MIAFPVSLDPDCPLQNLNFSTTSSRPTTLNCPSVEATCELVMGLVSNLNQSLHCDLCPEDFSSSEQQAMQGPADINCANSVILVGASNLKATKNLLSVNSGLVVHDITTPGWVASPAKINSLTPFLTNALLPEKVDKNAPVVLDLFSNSAYRFLQYDGTASLPLHGKSGYHLPGDVILAENSTIVRLIQLLKPILDLVRNRKKIFITPLPRYIVAGCCSNAEHCTNRNSHDYVNGILSELSRFHACLKKELRTAGVTDFWVLEWDIILSGPKPSLMSETLTALKEVCAADGVHFNAVGRGNMAASIGKAISSAHDGSLVPSRVAAPKKFFGRGFVSSVGSRDRNDVKRFHSHKSKGSLRSHPYSRN